MPENVDSGVRSSADVIKPRVDTLTRTLLDLVVGTPVLDGDAGKEIRQDLKKSLRHLVIAKTLRERHLVAVAGPQGAGKTTVVRALYDLDGWLRPNLGLGEQLPIFIMESTEVNRVLSLLIKWPDLLAGTSPQPLGANDLDRWLDAVRGGNPDVAYPELLVPSRYFPDAVPGSTGLLLLPGYELSTRKNRLWQELMRQALTGAAEVLVVTDSSLMATDRYKDVQADLRETYVDGALPLVAVNRCTVPAGDAAGLDAIRREAAAAFGCPVERVCCLPSVGTRPDVTELRDALTTLDQGLGVAAPVRMQILERQVSDDLGDVLDRVGMEIAARRDMVQQDHEPQLRRILGEFDGACTELRAQFEDRLADLLRQVYTDACAHAETLCSERLEGGDNLIRRIRNITIDFRPSANAALRSRIVAEAWHGADLTKPSRMTEAFPAMIDDVTWARLTAWALAEPDKLAETPVQAPSGQLEAGTGAATEAHLPWPTAVGLALTDLLSGKQPGSYIPDVGRATAAASRLLPVLALQWARLASTVPQLSDHDQANAEDADEALIQRTAAEFAQRLKSLNLSLEDTVRTLGRIAGLTRDGKDITSVADLTRSAVKARSAGAAVAASRLAGGAVAAGLFAVVLIDMANRTIVQERQAVFRGLYALYEAERDTRLAAFDELIRYTREVLMDASRRAYNLDEEYGRFEWLHRTHRKAVEQRLRLLDALGAGPQSVV